MAKLFGLLLCCFLFFGSALAQDVTVTAHAVADGKNHADPANAQEVVFWLTPLGHAAPRHPVPAQHPKLTQHNKTFEPHLLVIPVGSIVDFPNRDPFFHNVFSLFEGKRFDLGLYEGGTTREVHFDKPGISYIFCNIHAQMSAVVIAMDTPYYGISNAKGRVEIAGVPPGDYKLEVWYQESSQPQLKALSHHVTISANDSNLGTFHLAPPKTLVVHKNKYGQDYEGPPANSPGYENQLLPQTTN